VDVHFTAVPRPKIHWRLLPNSCRLHPDYTERGWQLSLELGAGHSVFIGLDADIASRVAQAARGEWEVLNAIEPVVPEGTWSSEFAWLFDGTVAAPLLYFIPTQVMIL